MAVQVASAGRAELRPAGERAVVAQRREAAAVPAGAAGARRQEAPGAEEVLRRVAQAVAPGAEEVRQPEEERVAEGELRPAVARAEALDVAAARLRAGPGGRAVRPSAPAWAALPWIRFRAGRLAPSPAAGTAHGTEGSRIAQRSMRWWPAARSEVVS
jgi:hypothetical protein